MADGARTRRRLSVEDLAYLREICAQCTLAVLPALEARAIRYFDCVELAREVKGLIAARKWRFASPPNAAMERWALGKEPS